MVDQLAANLLGVPLAAGDRLLPAKGSGLDRCGLGGLGLGDGDGLVVGHAIQHPVAADLGGLGVAERVVVVGRLGQHGEEGGLGQGQLVERLVEVGCGSGGDAVGLLAEVDFVEIELEDVFLAHALVDAQGEDQFLDLAGDADLVAEEHVLGDLLRDGRGADRTAAATVVQDVVESGAGDGQRVNATMGPELLIFGGDKGLLDHVGDRADRHEDAAFGGELGEQAVIAGIDAAHDFGLVGAEAVERGQFGGIALIGVPCESASSEAAEQAEQQEQADDAADETPEAASGPLWPRRAPTRLGRRRSRR